VRALGGDTERAVDVRVIAASRDDLDADVAAGRFAARISCTASQRSCASSLPRLRTRREDSPATAQCRGAPAPRGLATSSPPARNLECSPRPRMAGLATCASSRNVIDRLGSHSRRARKRFADLVIRNRGLAAGRRRSGGPQRHAVAEAKAAVLHDLERRYLADVLARTAGQPQRRGAASRGSIASTCVCSRASTAPRRRRGRRRLAYATTTSEMCRASRRRTRHRRGARHAASAGMAASMGAIWSGSSTSDRPSLHRRNTSPFAISARWTSGSPVVGAECARHDVAPRERGIGLHAAGLELRDERVIDRQLATPRHRACGRRGCRRRARSRRDRR